MAFIVSINALSHAVFRPTCINHESCILPHERRKHAATFFSRQKIQYNVNRKSSKLFTSSNRTCVEVFSVLIPEKSQSKPTQGLLSQDQLKFYAENGFVVLENFSSKEQCEKMRQRALSLVESFDPKTISVFSTKEQNRKSDDYFLSSGDKISFFFEEGAVAQDGTPTKPLQLAINKIGHAIHELDPVFREWSFSPSVQGVMKSLEMENPVVAQSMYIFKQPYVGGEVGPHQDSTFLYTDPPTCVGLWIALEDATVENGCLWGLPEPIPQPVLKRFARSEDAEGPPTKFIALNEGKWDNDKLVPLEVKQGSAIVLHGSFVHMSFENKSPLSRHAYSIHIIDGNLEWKPDNWLQRNTPFPSLYSS